MMVFFKTFNKVDGAANRGYACLPSRSAMNSSDYTNSLRKSETNKQNEK